MYCQNCQNTYVMIKNNILEGFSIYLLRVTLVSMSATPTTSGRSTWEVSEQTTISSLTKTLDANVILLPWRWCILTQKEPKNSEKVQTKAEQILWGTIAYYTKYVISQERCTRHFQPACSILMKKDKSIQLFTLSVFRKVLELTHIH